MIRPARPASRPAAASGAATSHRGGRLARALRAALGGAVALALSACGGGGGVGVGGSVGVGGGGVGVGVGVGTGVFGLGGGFGSGVPSFTLDAQATGPDTVVLVWSGRTDVREFVVVRGGAELTRVGGQTSSLTDRALTPGTIYCYQLFAFLVGGGGAYNRGACVQTWTGSTPPSTLSVPTRSAASPRAAAAAEAASSGAVSPGPAAPDAGAPVAPASPASPPWRAVGQAHAEPSGAGGLQRLRRGADGSLSRDWLGQAGSGSEPIAPAVGLAAGGWAAASLATCASATPCVVYGTGTPEQPQVARFAWRAADGAWVDEPLAAGLSVAPDALAVGADGVPVATLSAPDGTRVDYARTAAGWSAIARR